VAEDFIVVIVIGNGFTGGNFAGTNFLRRDFMSMYFTVIPAARFFTTVADAAVCSRRICGRVILIEGVLGQSADGLATLEIVSARMVVTLGVARIGFDRRLAIAEVGEQSLRLNLAFAEGSQIVSDGFVLVKTNLAGVGADKTFVEDTAGELVEMLVLDGTEHASADLGGSRDGLEREATQLALSAKFFSECTHSGLRRAEQR
jgi:hypothetical protein